MIFDDIARYGVVPVIALDDASAALPLADALIEGGSPMASAQANAVAIMCWSYRPAQL